MNVLELLAPGQFAYRQAEKPTRLKSSEALLKVHRIGICGTDLHAFTGKQPFFSYPRVLGHELGVEIMAIGGAVTNVRVGDRCSVEPYRNPTTTQAVRMGKPNCGEGLTVLGVHEDGGMAEYLIYQADLLHPGNALTYDQLALVEPLAIGCHAVDRADVTEADKVLVVGAGPIGLAVSTFSVLRGAQVATMDLNADRLGLCRTLTGVQHTLQPSGQTEAALRQCFDGEMPTKLIDATGNQASMSQSFNLVSYGGTIVFVGLFLGDMTFDASLFYHKGLTLKASRAALARDFTHIINAIEKHEFDPAPWITHRFLFNNVKDQFSQLFEPEQGVVKAIIDL